MAASNSQTNYEIFRDCLSDAVIARISNNSGSRKSKANKRHGKTEHDEHQAFIPNGSEDLAEFIDVSFISIARDIFSLILSVMKYLASEMFDSLSDEVKTLSYSVAQANPDLVTKLSSTEEAERLSTLLPVSVIDSIETYSLPDQRLLLSATITSYVDTTTAPPPVWVSTRASACELCERDWIPLSYHHLIPRSTHDKVLKRGWHEKWELNKVAWLCGACHRCVHRVETNEELAKNWHTVEKLKERDDIQRFIRWVGGVRWKKK
jgi:hypothetical protein